MYYFLQNNDLSELKLSGGIQVWGAKQETLEEQALKELNIFSKENKHGRKDNNLEEGEIDEQIVANRNDKLTEPTLDLDAYIKTQEALKKRQEFHKSLACTNVNTEIANRIAKKLAKPSAKRKKIKSRVVHSRETPIPSCDILDDPNSVKNNFNDIEQETVDVPAKKRKLNNNEATKIQDSLSTFEDNTVSINSEIGNSQDNSGSEYVPSEEEYGQLI